MRFGPRGHVGISYKDGPDTIENGYSSAIQGDLSRLCMCFLGSTKCPKVHKLAGRFTLVYVHVHAQNFADLSRGTCFTCVPSLKKPVTIGNGSRAIQRDLSHLFVCFLRPAKLPKVVKFAGHVACVYVHVHARNSA